jgi:23S rRNA (guanine2535-N1)-methyltransferase
MPYQFALDRDDYTDLAAGQVLYSLPGRPAFPVRLTSEIFQRCQAQLLQLGREPPYTVYDPCCGSAYLLVSLAYLHWSALQQLVGSDVDPSVLPLAERNLSLLTPAGIEARITQLARLSQQFGKPSHSQALASAQRLQARLRTYLRLHAIQSYIFAANALARPDLLPHLEHQTIDMIITDLPYGQRTTWQETELPPDGFGPGWQLLEALREIVAPTSILALTTNKQQKVSHEAYQRLEQSQIGKRRTLFFRLKA